MSVPETIRKALLHAGMAATVVAMGHLMMDIPGSGGVTSNFSELALMLCIPFLQRWYHALALASVTVFNVTPDGNILSDTLNHVVAYPLVWLAFQRWGRIRNTALFVAAWAAIIAAYYYAGLVPLLFLIRLVTGSGTLGENIEGFVAVSRLVVYEYIATTLLSIFLFLMMRELHLRQEAQADLELRNAELSHHRALLQAQYDATREGILVTASDGRFLSWNRRLLEIWTIDEDLLRAAKPGELLERVADKIEMPGEFLEKTRKATFDAANTFEDALRLKDGRVVMRFTTPLHVEGGNTHERVWFFHDITDLERAQAERHMLQEQLFQSQKMEAFGQLAGGIAHDFNNSLGIILGAAELAASEPLNEDARASIDMIVAAARRSASLTRKLLSFSRKTPRDTAIVDVANTLRDTAAMLYSSIDRSIAIEVHCDATRTRVKGDAGLLQNAFMNLGINASHAMPDGGALSFTLREVSLDRQACDASPFDLEPGRYLEISTSDTGCGIPAENLSRIFDPFFTTKEPGKGTGLGLSSVYGTVQEHHGALSVESKQGVGTTFRIILPLDASETDSVFTFDLADTPLPHGNATLLFVDDEEMLRRTATRSLENLGYTVIQACDGEEAVVRYRERSTEIRLVVLDMIMPRNGGRKALEGLRALSPSLPVLVCSGWANPDDLEAVRALGISAFLTKPYDRAQLAEAVARALSAGAPR